MLNSVFVLALVAWLQAHPAAPSFTGNWTLDPSQSVLADGGSTDIELLVTEGSNGLSVIQRTPRSEEKYTTPLDGTPKEERGPASIYVREVRRDRGALAWKVKMTRVADQASISFTERWTLSSDGNVLTVLRTYPTREVLKVFKRKK